MFDIVGRRIALEAPLHLSLLHHLESHIDIRFRHRSADQLDHTALRHSGRSQQQGRSKLARDTAVNHNTLRRRYRALNLDRQEAFLAGASNRAARSAQRIDHLAHRTTAKLFRTRKSVRARGNSKQRKHKTSHSGSVTAVEIMATAALELVQQTRKLLSVVGCGYILYLDACPRHIVEHQPPIRKTF